MSVTDNCGLCSNLTPDFTKATEPDGRPELNELGQIAMQGMHDNQWHLEIPKEYGQMW